MNTLPDQSILSPEQEQKIIRDATLIADYPLEEEPNINLADTLLKANCEPVKMAIGKLDKSGKQRLEELAKKVNHSNSN